MYRGKKVHHNSARRADTKQRRVHVDQATPGGAADPKNQPGPQPVQQPARQATPDLSGKSTAELLAEARATQEQADGATKRFEDVYQETMRVALEDGIVDRQEAERLWLLAHTRQEHNQQRLSNAEKVLDDLRLKVRPRGVRSGVAAFLVGIIVAAALLTSVQPAGHFPLSWVL